ncbi:acid phosphatase-like protein [Plenodomus tracheiphilus IPT5]|uniref:Acid phosphatase-like protein n=1 Tax=Plenodomus tracheiphilus IPT5 TaxID=1408161 RepID=A0A6A7ATM1_9PLEO|nr:acid phosphatase-like protein [Plenodomus tracheiphilus IPT5]
MHILITNDDGPPSDQSSPYIHSLVTHLQSAGHTVSVILPHTQRSWIGKAHLVGKSVTPSYYRPRPLRTTPEGRLTNDGSTHTTPLPPNSQEEEWVLVDSTPASCVQIGLFHYFSSRGPIDLVVSGPNYGRNSTAVFSLSSGTIGGAMEAAVCGAKSIALSYAFFDRNHDASIISDASALSTKLIQYLWDNWDPNTQLYSVNVPLVEGVGAKKILYTDMLQNSWTSGSCFQVVHENPQSSDEDPESAIREQEAHPTQQQQQQSSIPENSSTTKAQPPHARYTHKSFKWAPRFKDVYDSVEASEPGNDGWAVAQGYTSVTPLRANFMHVGNFKGEISLGGDKKEGEGSGLGKGEMTAEDAERQSDDR